MKKAHKTLFFALFAIALFTSCEKEYSNNNNPSYTNGTGPNNNNNWNNPVNNVHPPDNDTSWYYSFPVNVWVSIKNFYLRNNDFVFKSLNIPSDEFLAGDFIVEMCWYGNTNATLRYRCLRPSAIDHMGLSYIVQEQIITFSFRYTGKNTDELPLYGMSFPSGVNLNITYEPQSNTVQRYLDLTQWNGGYILHRESDGLFNLAQSGNNTSAMFFGPM